MSDDLENDDATAIKIGSVLVLNQIGNSSETLTYVVCIQKALHIATVPKNLLYSFSIKTIPFSSVLNARYYSRQLGEISILSIKCISLLSEVECFSLAKITKESDKNTKKDLIVCNALTNGCFTYMDWEYTKPAVYNDILGIISDDLENPLLPKQEIGRLLCAVSVKKLNGEWHFFIEEVRSFEKMFSITMSAQLKNDEHYGLVTREECEEKRDLRLVSSRDFPRDVRIFKSGTHCCGSAEVKRNKKSHDHSKCLNCGIGEARLLGKSLAIRMTKCHGMALSAQDAQSSSISSPVNSAEGSHVDGRYLREDVTQLCVNVNQGFVEVETISEYMGHSDHNGFPLLWSHDLEFVVDFSRTFQDKPFGLYIVKVVRFHRKNVFAKWRLARRSPIVRSLQTTFHSRLTHSVNLSTLGVDELLSSKPDTDKSSSRFSFSRFGADAQSCCLPRTDSLDNVPLFDAVFHDAKEKLQNLKIGETYKDDESMWLHHDSLAMKIVEEETENGSDTEVESEAEVGTRVRFEIDSTDENSNALC